MTRSKFNVATHGPSRLVGDMMSGNGKKDNCVQEAPAYAKSACTPSLISDPS